MKMANDRSIHGTLAIRLSLNNWAGDRGKGNKYKMAAKLKDKRSINTTNPNPIPIICNLPDPPTFSLVTAFKAPSFTSVELHYRPDCTVVRYSNTIIFKF